MSVSKPFERWEDTVAELLKGTRIYKAVCDGGSMELYTGKRIIYCDYDG